MIKPREFGFKITVIGDGGVGKTSLIRKYTEGAFEKDYVKTMGAQFSIFDKDMNGDEIKLIFWDIAGQDDFKFLHPLFYKESKACIIVYSLEENNLGTDSFTHIENWYNESYKYCGDIPVVLFANKVDLVNENELDNTKVQKIVDNYNFLGFFLTSAKTGEGVIEAFNAIIEKLYYRIKTLHSEEVNSK
ncbi:MAG: Rab family GTPase [Candidatus Thorarchaeota archaeon]